MKTSSEGAGGESTRGLSGHIKLCIVSITVKMNAIVLKDVAEREEGNNKLEWSQP